MLPEIIIISQIEDFRYFGNEYTEVERINSDIAAAQLRRRLKEKYQSTLFEFHFDNFYFTDQAIPDEYRKIIKRYGSEHFLTVFDLLLVNSEDFERLYLLLRDYTNGNSFLRSISFALTFDVIGNQADRSILSSFCKFMKCSSGLPVSITIHFRGATPNECINDANDLHVLSKELNAIDTILSPYSKNCKDCMSYEFHLSANQFLLDNAYQDEVKRLVADADHSYDAKRLRTVFDLNITKNADYETIFQIAPISDDGRLSSPKGFPNCGFDLALNFCDNTVDELLLHNYLLLFMKAHDLSLKLFISIEAQQNNPEFYRIATYLSSCSNELKRSITIFTKVGRKINKKLHPISYSARAFGKILPAIPLDKSILQFLGNPLNSTDLEYVLSRYQRSTPTSSITEGIKELSPSPDETSHADPCKMSLLDSCRRYLMWSKFAGHESKNYQAVREMAFLCRAFREQAQGMPFLALLLFAQYDYYYRSSIVKEFKDRITTPRNRSSQLKTDDVIADYQPFQEYARFLVYKKMCREQMDIKSLVTLVSGVVLSGKKLDQAQLVKSIRLHEAVISDLFGARTMAEGLLQLIENAVLHANGGLLSIRIREYVPTDVGNASGDTAFLKTKYENYFIKKAEIEGATAIRADEKRSDSLKSDVIDLPDVIGKQFYLEVKLSDLAKMNMKEKFYHNTEDRASRSSYMSESAKVRTLQWLEMYQDEFNTFESEIFKLFFDPSPNQNKLWKEYYNISANRVHHFGLQIFDSVLRSRNGGFCVSGHNDIYAPPPFIWNNESSDVLTSSILKEDELDKSIEGTSYRILLPLNHESVPGSNVIVDTSFDRLLSWKEMDKYRAKSDRSINHIPIVISMLNWGGPIPQKHEAKIETLANTLQESIQKNIRDDISQSYLIVFDYSRLFVENALNSKIEFTEEEITKSILLYLLKQQEATQQPSPPIAIIGLSSHTLLEVTRIIALFYDKKGEPTEGMKNIQIYLRGQNVGEEILFAGSNIYQTADRITRLALTRGSSAEYFSIAQQLLSR